MPGWRVVGTDAHLEQRLDDAKQTLEHGRLGEVLLHLLVVEGVALLLQALARERQVPGLQIGQTELVASESAQFGEIALGAGSRAPGEVAQEVAHLLRRLGHLRHE
jgi:hypothetical protein